VALVRESTAERAMESLIADGRAALAQTGAAWIGVVAHDVCADDAGLRWLTPTERERAARYRAAHRRRGFVGGRTVVRRLLCRGDGHTPEEWVDSGAGKPRAPGHFHFNLSHTASSLGLAVDAAGPIGIDIESFARLNDVDGLIEMSAHPAEVAVLRAVDGRQLESEFLRCWTRKEALLKASGLGVTRTLAALDTRLTERTPVFDTEEGGPWRVLDLPLPGASGLIGAVVVSTQVKQVVMCIVGH
jgi:phosphopantetheinyl transferase